MNAFGAFVLAALLLEYGLSLAADLLNLRALRAEAPEGLRDVYDPATYRRSQEYTRARTRFGLIPATFDLVLLLGFWFGGGFAALDRAIVDLERGPIVSGLLFIGALVLGKSILGLPFDWWSTFKVEERFGFNKTTPKTFWMDRLKGLLLGVILGGALLAAVLFFFERFEHAWLWCWGVTTFFVLALQYVAPTWIMPLFNRFEPMEEGELRGKILAYAERVGFPLAGLFVIDGSRRSTKANAFFTGFGKNKRVALFDTLIEKHEPDELLAVVAHEIGHYKRKHIVKGTAISILHTGLLFWLLSIFLTEPGLFEAFGLERVSTAAGLVFFGLLYTPVELVLQVFLQAYSRRNEFEADAYAVETTGLGSELARGLKKLSADNLSNLTPHPFYVALHHSHPPLGRRVAAIEARGSGGAS